jgi:hypothetical protein
MLEIAVQDRTWAEIGPSVKTNELKVRFAYDLHVQNEG